MVSKDIYDAYIQALYNYDKKSLLALTQEHLRDGSLTIVQLYEELLADSLHNIGNNHKKQDIKIWQEHLLSNLVRSVIENAYPFVQAEKNKFIASKSFKTVICCLSEEYHDIGARMVQDYLEILNFRTYFLGANTPSSEINNAVETLSPDLLVISVSNYYHLSKLQKLMDSLKQNANLGKLKIAIGGYAIQSSSHINDIQADFIIENFQDLLDMKEVLS